MGLCAQFSSLMFSGYWGFMGGGMLFFAQYWGAKDDDGIERSYGLTLTCMMCVAAVFTALGNDVLQIDLSFLDLLGWFCLASLMVNELRSIIENFVEMGYNVPVVLTKGLQVAADLIETKAGGEEHGTAENKLD